MATRLRRRYSRTGTGRVVREAPLARARRLERQYGKHYFVYRGNMVLNETEAARIARGLLRRWIASGERSKKGVTRDMGVTGRIPRHLETWVRNKGRGYDIPGVDTKSTAQKLRNWGLMMKPAYAEIRHTEHGWALYVTGSGSMPDPRTLERLQSNKASGKWGIRFPQHSGPITPENRSRFYFASREEAERFLWSHVAPRLRRLGYEVRVKKTKAKKRKKRGKRR